MNCIGQFSKFFFSFENLLSYCYIYNTISIVIVGTSSKSLR